MDQPATAPSDQPDPRSAAPAPELAAPLQQPPPSLSEAEQTTPPVPSDPDEGLLRDAFYELMSLLNAPHSIVSRSTKESDTDLGDILGSIHRALVDFNTGDGTWRWHYDFRGRVVDWSEAAPEHAFVPISPDKLSKSEILRRIQAVFQLDSDIRAWTDSFLDLNKLAVEIRLLDQSVMFTTFQSSATRYQKDAGAGEAELPYPDLSIDKNLISDYYNLIGRAMPGIRLAFVLADLMASEIALPITPRRFYNCLRTLSDELEFADKPAEALAADLFEYSKDSEVLSPAMQGKFTGEGIQDAWLTHQYLERSRNFLIENAGPLAPGISPVARYFSDRFEALARATRTNERMALLPVIGLLVRAKDSAGRYRGFPETIPLGDYARLLFETSSLVNSEEFHLALLAELGFGDAVQSWVAADALRFKPNIAEKIIDVARFRRVTGERVLLILREPPAEKMIGDEKIVIPAGPLSPFSGWPPSAQHAVCPVFAGSRSWPQPQFLLPLFTLVLIDGFADLPGTLPSAAPPQIVFPPSAFVARSLTSADLSEPPSLPGFSPPVPQYPRVMDPKSLDDAIAQARRLSSPSAPAGPPSPSTRFDFDTGSPKGGAPHPPPMA